MKRITRILILFIFLLPLAGCYRMATYPTLDLSRFTPQAEVTLSPEAFDTFTATPTYDLASDTEQALQTYPLWIGSSWVYEYLGFDQEREVVWRVVETVVSTQLYQDCYAAEVTRTVELQEGSPNVNFPIVPEEGSYWLVLAEGNLYRVDSLDSFNPDTAWLELLLPFPEDTAGWYPDPEIRAMKAQTSDGLRTSSEPFQQTLPMGGMYTCYSVMTQAAEGIAKGTFCDGVGYVYLEYTQVDQKNGYRAELTGFSLQ